MTPQEKAEALARLPKHEKATPSVEDAEALVAEYEGDLAASIVKLRDAEASYEGGRLHTDEPRYERVLEALKTARKEHQYIVNKLGKARQDAKRAALLQSRTQTL